MSFDLFVQSCIILKRMTDVFKKYDDDRDGFITLSFEEFLTGKFPPSFFPLPLSDWGRRVWAELDNRDIAAAMRVVYVKCRIWEDVQEVWDSGGFLAFQPWRQRYKS